METLVMLTRIRLIAFTALLSSVAITSHAATLATHFGSALGGSTNTVNYDSGSGIAGLYGDLHYAVFTDTAYNSIFTNSTISIGPGELAYVYQLINTGADPVSKNQIVNLSSTVTGIGYADINVGGAGEISPATVIAPPPVAVWDYNPGINNIPSGLNSSALVLRSSKLPDGTTTDVIFNGGGIGLVQVIKPGTVDIPEPVSAVLLMVGSSLLIFRRRR